MSGSVGRKERNTQMGLNLCDRCVADCRHQKGPNEIVVECGAFKPPMTNADRFRAMSDEELADLFSRFAEGDDTLCYCRNLPECDADLAADRLIPLERCQECLLYWLQQPAEGGEEHDTQL